MSRAQVVCDKIKSRNSLENVGRNRAHYYSVSKTKSDTETKKYRGAFTQSEKTAAEVFTILSRK